MDEASTSRQVHENDSNTRDQNNSTGDQHVPDGGWGWVVCFASFMLQAFTVGVTYTFGVIFVDLLAYFNTTESKASWIGSIQPALLYFTAIIAAPLVKRIGWRIVAIGGSCLSAIGFTTSALAPNIYVMYFTYGVLTGLGNGCMYVTSMIAVQHYFKKRRALATGIAVSGSGVGTLIFGMLSQYLLDHVGWRYTVAIDGGIALVVGGLCGLLFKPLAPQPTTTNTIPENVQHTESKAFNQDSSRDSRNRLYGSLSYESDNSTTLYDQEDISPVNETSGLVKCDSKKNKTEIASKKTGRKSVASRDFTDNCQDEAYVSFPGQEVVQVDPDSQDCCPCSSACCRGFQCLSILKDIFDLSLFKNPVFSLYSISVLMFAFGYHVPYTYTPERAIMMGISPRQASFLISIMGLSNVGFRLVLGWIADKSANIRFYFGGAALTLMGALGLSVKLFTTYKLLIVYSVLFGAFSGSFAALFPVILVDLMGLPVLEETMGKLMAVSSIAFLVASPMSGLIIGKTGNIDIPFLVVGGLGIFGGFAYFLMRCFLYRYGHQTDYEQVLTPAEKRNLHKRFISESFA